MLVMKSNESLQHLENLLRHRDMEAKIISVTPFFFFLLNCASKNSLKFIFNHKTLVEISRHEAHTELFLSYTLCFSSLTPCQVIRKLL